MWRFTAALVLAVGLPGCYEAAQGVVDGGGGSDVRLTYALRPLYVPEEMLETFSVMINGHAYSLGDSVWGLAAVYETTMPWGPRFPTVPLSVEVIDSASGALLATSHTEGHECTSQANTTPEESAKGVVEIRVMEILGYDPDNLDPERTPWSLLPDCRFCTYADPEKNTSWCS